MNYHTKFEIDNSKMSELRKKANHYGLTNDWTDPNYRKASLLKI